MRRLLPNLLLAAASLLALFGVLEAVARLTLAPAAVENFTPVPLQLVERSSVPGLRYVLRPGASAVHRFPSDPRGYLDPGATLTYRINRLGLRGPETTRRKPPGTRRILGLGDSLTFGSGVRQPDTFLAVLQRELDASRGEGAYEVLNLGVTGYDTVDEVRLLEHTGLALEPDLVLLCFFPNDTGARGVARFFEDARQMERPDAWWRRSRLVDRLAARLARQRAGRLMVEAVRDAFRPDAPGWLRAQAALGEADGLAREHGFELALVILPVLWQLSGEHPFAEVHARVAAAGRALGLPVLDLLPAFDGHDGPELWVQPTNQHPNEVGHALAGRALARFLLEEPGLLR